MFIYFFMVFFIGRTGFEDERIEAVLHKIEISQKHQSTTFGLNLIAVRIHFSFNLWDPGSNPPRGHYVVWVFSPLHIAGVIPDLGIWVFLPY